MMRREHLYVLAATVIILLVAAGCTLKKPVSAGCCVINESGLCGELKDAGPETTFTGCNSCNLTAGTCNITIDVDLGSAEITSNLNVPICDNKSGSCLEGDCVAQLCGDLHYNPTPVPSYKDSQKFEAEARDTGKVSAAENIRKEKPVGLYGTTCEMLPADDLLLNFLQNSKGSFINTFRFGVGGSFEEFDKYRWLFPLSDNYCNANPFAGARERYMNYLLTPWEFEMRLQGYPYSHPDDLLDQEGYCLWQSVSPFLGQLYNGGDSPNYRRYPVVMPKSGTTHTEFDKLFYVNFLYLMYEKDLLEGTESFAGVPTPAPFECQTSLDCGSAYCNFQDYNRMLCKNTVTGKWVRCGCDAAARRCLGQQTNITYYNNGSRPMNASDMELHVDGYLQGQTYFHIYRLPVGLVHINIDPDCSVGGTLEGADSIVVGSQSSGSVFDLINNGVISVTEDELNQLTACATSQPTLASACAGGDQASCDQLEACQDYADTILARAPLTGGTGEVLDDVKFPNDIFFFGEKKSGFIGYTLLSENRFQQTDFYRECHPSYEFRNAAQQFQGVTLDPNAPTYHGDNLEERDDVTSAVYSAMLFIPPDPVPSMYGWDWDNDNHIECHWDGDDHGHYRYVPRYIMIKDTGNCELRTDTWLPVTKSFGWCEPCSYSTLAKQSVTTISKYNPLAQINYTSYPYNEGINTPHTLCYQDYEGDGFSMIPILRCYDTYDPKYDDGDYTIADFNAFPDSIYLMGRQSQYLKEGIMPVLDVTHPSNWDEAGFDFMFGSIPPSMLLRNAFLPRGPSIIIADKITGGTINASRLNMHVDEVREYCPTCIVAIKVVNGAPVTRNITQRIAADQATLRLINDTSAPGLMAKIDMIAFEFYPNEYTLDNPSTCNLPIDQRNENILQILENASREKMVLTQKPAIVTDFWVNEDSCWPREKSKSFFSFLFLKQKRLAKSGLMGMIYSNSSTLLTSDVYTSMFCALEQGAHNLVADEPVTVFSKVYTTPQDQVKCEACTDFDVAFGTCNKTCPDGVECNADATSIALAKAQLNLPASTPDSQVPLRCPLQSMPETCPKCADSTESITCKFFYSNGTSQTAEFNISTLSVLYADVISSIPTPYRCCLEDETGNFSYVKQTTTGKITAPLLFSTNGDPREDCGVTDVSALEKPLCNLPLPIKNHKVECSVGGASDVDIEQMGDEGEWDPG